MSSSQLAYLYFLCLLLITLLSTCVCAQSTHTVCASGCDHTTLSAAIFGASSGDVIDVRDAVHTEADIVVDKDLTIQGQGQTVTTIQAAASQATATDGVFFVDRGTIVVFQNLRIQNGNALTGVGNAGQNDGGGVYIDCNAATNVSFVNVTISGNRADDDGGGIFTDGDRGVVTLTNCVISGNEANAANNSSSGGGIHNRGALTLSLSNCSVVNNSSGQSGGGLVSSQGGETVTLTNCTVAGNTANLSVASVANGGGINLSFVDVCRLINCTVTGNNISGVSGTHQGGGIAHFENGELEFINTIVANNTAGVAGSVGVDVYVNSSSASFTQTTSLVIDCTQGGGSCPAFTVTDATGLATTASTCGEQTYYAIAGSAAEGNGIAPGGDVPATDICGTSRSAYNSIGAFYQPPTTFTWTGAVSTDWHTAGNWDFGVVPGPGAHVVIDVSDVNPTVFASGTDTIGSLLVLDAGSFTLADGAGLVVTGGDDAVRVEGFDFIVNGQLRVENEDSGYGIVVRASLTVSNTGSITLVETGLENDGTVSLNGALLVNDAPLDGITIAGGNFNVQSQGTCSISGARREGFYQQDGRANVNGELLIDQSGESGLSIGEAELTINGTGTVTVTDAGDDGIRMESASNRLDNRGTLIINGSTNEAIAGNEVRCYNGSVFRVEGTVSAAMEWRSGSRIEPGSSPGCLALVPDAPVGTTLAGATYAVELEGNTPCTGYDQMTFEDDLTITDAVLELSGDYVPSLNETFTIVDLDDNYTLTGTFANLAEGATLFFNTTTLQISYVGGTGNDIVLTCTEVPAVPLTWTGAEDGNWGNVNNWDGGTVPGAGDAVIVPPAPNAAVVNTGFARAGSIAVAGGELTIAGGTILIVQDQPTGITVTDGGSVTVNGPLQVTGQPGTGILVADGQFTVAGGSTTASSLIVQEAGSLTVAEDAEVTLEDNGGGLVVGGPTQLDGELFVGPQTGFGVQIVAPFTVGPAGLFALDQTVLFLADTLVIAGELTLEDAEFGGILSLGANDYLDVQEGGSCTITRPGNTGLSFNGGGTVRVAGRLSIIDGADEGVFFETGAWTITETGEVFVTDCGGEGILLDRSTILLDNSGLLSVTGSGDEALRGGQLLNRATSTLRANGNLNGNVDVVSGARIEPGASPGCLTFQQSLYLDGVTLAVEIDGSTACTGYDQLVFADTLDLSGSILELSGDYVPALGDVFTIIAESGSANQLGTFTGLPEGGTVDFNGATLAITYQGGAGDDVMLTAIAVLPLDLLSFTGEARDKTNLLTWKTANEEDFSHFEVERSSADRWETIGIIAGGQSGQYSFEDAATTAYYRLKMIDLDGTFSYSEVVYLENFSGANAGAMLVYPNPSTGRFTVDLSEASLPADRGGELRLVDLHGREIWARRVSLDQAIELSHTLAGVYLLMLITDDNQTQTQRIVIH